MIEKSDQPITRAPPFQSNNTGHQPLWNEVKFIDRDLPYYTAGSKRQSIPDFTLIKINRDGGVEILEVWMPNIRKKHNKRRVFSRNGLFLDYLFAENRILELTLVIRSMKREEEKWWPHVGTSSYQNYANSAFLLLYSSIPILPFLIYPTILCKFFTLAKKFAEVRIIVVFLFVFFFF